MYFIRNKQWKKERSSAATEPYILSLIISMWHILKYFKVQKSIRLECILIQHLLSDQIATPLSIILEPYYLCHRSKILNRNVSKCFQLISLNYPKYLFGINLTNKYEYIKYICAGVPISHIFGTKSHYPIVEISPLNFIDTNHKGLKQLY